MKKWQEFANKNWQEKKYKADILTLGLGLCEEAGEVAKAINVFCNPLYIPRKDRSKYDSVEHELRDLLMYVSHIANTLNISLDVPGPGKRNCNWKKIIIDGKPSYQTSCGQKIDYIDGMEICPFCWESILIEAPHA